MDNDMTREKMEQRLDELAREFGRTHDQAVLKQIEELALRIAALRTKVQCTKRG